MCELFGFSGIHKTLLNAELKEFFSHAGCHPNGWGLALLNQDYNIEKEPVRADQSQYLRERLQEPVIEKNLLAHIRLATIGPQERKNCHPFTGTDVTGRKWILIHNGTIFDYPRMNRYIKIQKGNTDSERILLHILDLVDTETINRGRELKARERFNLIDKMAVTISKGNKLSIIVYDGETMYAHTNCNDNLHLREDGNGICISTHPLSEGQWRPVPFCRLLGFQNGSLKYTGTQHDHEYIFNEEDMKAIYLAYSGL